MSMLTCMSSHNYDETGDKYSLQGGWIEKNNALSTQTEHFIFIPIYLRFGSLGCECNDGI